MTGCLEHEGWNRGSYCGFSAAGLGCDARCGAVAGVGRVNDQRGFVEWKGVGDGKQGSNPAAEIAGDGLGGYEN